MNETPDCCTAPHCRTLLKWGDGNQFVNAAGDLERYCWRHWQEYMAPAMGPEAKVSAAE